MPSTRWSTRSSAASSAGDTTVLEFDVVYTYPDGHSHLVPSVAILHRGASGLLDSLRVYVERPH